VRQPGARRWVRTPLLPALDDARFDRGAGGTVRNGELVCGRHGATFGTDTGYCDFGPGEDADLSTGSPGGRIDFTGS
jgi:hypothetical protein